jgi:hypothetical protein
MFVVGSDNLCQHRTGRPINGNAGARQDCKRGGIDLSPLVHPGESKQLTFGQPMRSPVRALSGRSRRQGVQF